MDMEINFPNLGIYLDYVGKNISIFGFSIAYYGIVIVTGMMIAIWIAQREAKRTGQNPEQYLDLAMIGIAAGILGARIYYVIFAWDYYKDDLLSIFNIRQGGLAIYGGIIGGAVTLLVVAKRKKIPAPVLLDVAGMGVIIGQLMGRWGNFMNREAHGAVTDTFLKMGLQDASGVVTYYHPTFLYESVWNLIGFIGLHFFSKKRKFDGEVFLAYVAWYGLGRVWIEGLRTDSLYLFSTGIRVSQLVAAVSFLAAAGILAWVLVKKKPARESLYVNRKREEPQADEKQDD